MRALKGKLAAQTVVVSLGSLEERPSKIVVTTSVQADANAKTAAKSAVVKDELQLEYSEGGNVSVARSGNSKGASAAIVTYAGNGPNLVVSFPKFPGPNGLARCEVEHISRGP